MKNLRDIATLSKFDLVGARSSELIVPKKV